MKRKYILSTIIFFLISSVPVMSRASTSGVLRVHPSNPRYFTDDTGKAIYMTGSQIWFSVHGSPRVTPTYQRMEVYLDWLESHGHNFVRLWTGWGDLVGYDPYPWKRTGSGSAFDEKPKLDMTKFNQSYFDALRERVLQIQHRGMYCAVMIFGSHNRSRTPEGWKSVAWHPDNNINPELAEAFDPEDGFSFFASDGDALGIQRKLIEKMVDTLNDVDNLVWEIMNEAEPTDGGEWQYGMIKFLKRYEEGKPKQHLVGMTGGWRDHNPTYMKSPAEWWSPDRKTLNYRTGGPAHYSDKITLNDTDHLWGYSTLGDVEAHRKWVWKTFTRGNHPIYMDNYDAYLPNLHNYGVVNPGYDPVRKAMGDTLLFAKKVEDLAGMFPTSDKKECSTTYCLRKAGDTYIAYQPEPGEFTVKLPKGAYEIEWFDPGDSSTSTRTIHHQGGVFSIGKPSHVKKDSVVLITIVK